MARNRSVTKRENHRTYLKNDASFHPSEDERGRPADTPPAVSGAFGQEQPAAGPKGSAVASRDEGERFAPYYNVKPKLKSVEPDEPMAKENPSLFGRVRGWIGKWMP